MAGSGRSATISLGGIGGGLCSCARVPTRQVGPPPSPGAHIHTMACMKGGCTLPCSASEFHLLCIAKSHGLLHPARATPEYLVWRPSSVETHVHSQMCVCLLYTSPSPRDGLLS
eukprot:5828254-Pleurochrysis_carterae.AAC.1